MNPNVPAKGDASARLPEDARSMEPLEDELGIPSVTEARASSISWKGVLAVSLLVLSLVAVTALSLNRVLGGHKRDQAEKRLGERPMAAATEPRRLDLAFPPADKASQPATGFMVPAIVPDVTDDTVEPIGVRRTGQGAKASDAPDRTAPEDAPVMLVSSRKRSNTAPGSVQTGDADPAPTPTAGDSLDATRQNLQAYQRQLQGTLATLTRSAQAATGQSPAGLPAGGLGVQPAGANAGGGLFGGQLQGTSTQKVVAGTLGDRSLILPKGTSFTCALKTRVVSAASGLIGCQVQRNVYSDDGRVLLIERGSHLDGEYRTASVRPGTVRIPVLWTRIRTPNGVIVDIDSPGTGALGESGIDGYVDNRWGERIGAAMLLSLIDDSVKLVIENQSNDRQGDTVILPSTTANTSKLAEKVLDSTINIPPLIYQNQGGIVGIYVARDVDFSSVYELKTTP